MNYNNGNGNVNDMGSYVRQHYDVGVIDQKRFENITFQPVTPGPRTIHDLHTEAKQRFIGIIFMEKDPNRSTEDYFYEYDFWEKYSETNHYNKKPYSAIYKGSNRKYVNYLCILGTDTGEEYYVASKRIPTELESLEKYCRCSKCQSSFFNPMKYIWCKCCTGCIQAGEGFADKQIVEKARKLKLVEENLRKIKTTNEKTRFNKIFPFLHYNPSRLFDHINSVKLVETVIVISLSAFVFSLFI